MKKLFLAITMLFFTGTVFAYDTNFSLASKSSTTGKSGAKATVNTLENVGKWYWPSSVKSIKTASDPNTFSTLANVSEWYWPSSVKSIKTNSNANTFSNVNEWYWLKI